MKKIILTLLMFVSVISFSQTTSEVVSVDSTLTKSNLYSNALAFFALEFKSANNVIQMKDAETGKVIGKGIVDDRSITITISCKDGKYKYDITLEKIKPIQVSFRTTFGDIQGETYGFINYNDSNKVIIRSVAFIPSSVKGEYVEYSDFKGNISPYKGKRKEDYITFKQNIELELRDLYIKYLELILNKDKVLINQITSDLKREMSKKSDW